MSAQMQAYYAAVKAARIALLEREIAAAESRLIELRLDEPDASVAALSKAEERECLAARDLFRAVEELPADRKPKGWYEA